MTPGAWRLIGVIMLLWGLRRVYLAVAKGTVFIGVWSERAVSKDEVRASAYWTQTIFWIAFSAGGVFLLVFANSN